MSPSLVSRALGLAPLAKGCGSFALIGSQRMKRCPRTMASKEQKGQRLKPGLLYDGFPHPRTLPRRAARREEADPGARALLWARLLPGRLRDVRLRADEPDRGVRGVSAAVPALEVRDGVRATPQAAPLRA